MFAEYVDLTPVESKAELASILNRREGVRKKQANLSRELIQVNHNKHLLKNKLAPKGTLPRYQDLITRENEILKERIDLKHQHQVLEDQRDLLRTLNPALSPQKKLIPIPEQDLIDLLGAINAIFQKTMRGGYVFPAQDMQVIYKLSGISSPLP